jgi:hypothetical protein
VPIAIGDCVGRSAVRARGFIAIQPEQSLHYPHLHNSDDGTAQIAAQFDTIFLNHGDDATGTTCTSDPMSHQGHQAGEFIAELGVHDAYR